MIRQKEPQVASELEKRLQELEKADLRALRQQWLALFRNAAPPRMHYRMLLKAIAWKIQVNVIGDVSAATFKTMQKVAAELTARRLRPRIEGRSDWKLKVASKPRAGTRLIRVWNSNTYVVEVTPRGYEFQSNIYRSLSVIAQRIAGTKWNGPLFFGLRDNRLPNFAKPLQPPRTMEKLSKKGLAVDD